MAGNIGDVSGAIISSASSIGRFIPEPRSGIANRVRSAFSAALNGVGAIVGGGSFPGVQNQFVDVLNAQLEAQQQMQLVTLYSNVEKFKHETSMVGLRNVRVG